MNIREQRLNIAAVHLRDALQSDLSQGTRASCAFDAGYTWLLVALDTPTGQTHPDIEAFQQAIDRLNVDPRQMEIAIEYLKKQYSPIGPGDLLARLLVWAQAMQKLAGAS